MKCELLFRFDEGSIDSLEVLRAKGIEVDEISVGEKILILVKSPDGDEGRTN